MKRTRLWDFYLLAVLVFAIDQLTKAWVRAAFSEEGDGVSLLGNLLWLRHVQNEGGVFGLPVPTLVLIVVAILGIGFYLFWGRQLVGGEKGMLFALALQLGGAAGNLCDRLRLGYVTDFIDLGISPDLRWPAFNIADAALTVGAIILVVMLLRSRGGTHKA